MKLFLQQQLQKIYEIVQFIQHSMQF